MALYTTLASLSQTAASNAADGTADAPSTIDNQLNLLASFIAQLRDGSGFTGIGQGRLIGIQVFSANGTYTPTTGTTSVVVEAVGGGGGGGGTAATGGAQIAAAGGGGGATYGKSRYTSAFSGLPVTVGAAGAAGAAAGAGGNGGSSSFGALLVCPGGTGGQAGAAVPVQSFSAAIVGSVGVVSGANIFSSLGQFSGPAFSFSGSQLLSGAGGSSIMGAGGQPRLNVTAVGLPGNGYGSGGSGAAGGSGVAAQVGGAGAPGLVVIYEYA